MPFSKKAFLRKAAERTIPLLRRRIRTSRVASPQAKLATVSGMQAMREIDRNLL
jgi:hypothetical protein